MEVVIFAGNSALQIEVREFAVKNFPANDYEYSDLKRCLKRCDALVVLDVLSFPYEIFDLSSLEVPILFVFDGLNLDSTLVATSIVNKLISKVDYCVVSNCAVDKSKFIDQQLIKSNTIQEGVNYFFRMMQVLFDANNIDYSCLKKNFITQKELLGRIVSNVVMDGTTTTSSVIEVAELGVYSALQSALLGKEVNYKIVDQNLFGRVHYNQKSNVVVLNFPIKKLGVKKFGELVCWADEHLFSGGILIVLEAFVHSVDADKSHSVSISKFEELVVLNGMGRYYLECMEILEYRSRVFYDEAVIGLRKFG